MVYCSRHYVISLSIYSLKAEVNTICLQGPVQQPSNSDRWMFEGEYEDLSLVLKYCSALVLSGLLQYLTLSVDNDCVCLAVHSHQLRL